MITIIKKNFASPQSLLTQAMQRKRGTLWQQSVTINKKCYEIISNSIQPQRPCPLQRPTGRRHCGEEKPEAGIIMQKIEAIK
jgi:hypothetical protein